MNFRKALKVLKNRHEGNYTAGTIARAEAKHETAMLRYIFRKPSDLKKKDRRPKFPNLTIEPVP